jgi:DNA-binding NtrC family response regulator
MPNFKIFIVEDNLWYAEILKHHLSLNPDNEIHIFENAKDCLSNLYLNPQLITVDFQLPDLTGEELLKRIKNFNNLIPVIIISGQEDISTALNLLKKGAYDYLLKDDNTKEILWNDVLKIRENLSLKKQVENLQDQLEQKYDASKTIIGQSEKLKVSFKLIEKATKSNINVSISGQTGTGKELVAKAIHFNSARSKKPFIAVNMAAIPKELVESELFGHEQGAFTGANARKKGKFEEANGGTIFLDEIGELDINIQSKLLRALQEREITRVGGNAIIKFDARLIIATHKNLAKEVQEGNFREDLYYRIIGLPIELPSLKEREGDILILANYFIEKYAAENKTTKKSLSEKAKKKLLVHNYPGNIRELKSTIDLACVLSDSNEIDENDITFNSIIQNEIHDFSGKTLKDITLELIKERLKSNNNNVIETSKSLDIGKSTIYNLIKSGDLKI